MFCLLCHPISLERRQISAILADCQNLLLLPNGKNIMETMFILDKNSTAWFKFAENIL
jgi:hypothetical protein